MNGKMKKCLFSLAAVSLLFPAISMADSISPATYSADLAIGESTTIHKTVTITEEVTSAKVDVFFLTDTTGSMGGLINSVITSASEILSSASSFGDVAFGVGEYKDIYDSYTYRLNTALTTDTAAVQTGINMYSASGGGDWPEANLFALDKVATETAWRDDSTRILVWFGDAYGHDPRAGVSETEAIASLVAENIVVEAMNTGTASSGLDATGQASRITAATGGDYYATIGTSAIVETINDAIASVFEEYGEVSLDLSGVPAGLTATVDPGSYTGDWTREGERTFEFDVEITGDVAGSYAFGINALVDGGIVAIERDKINVSAIPEPGTMLLFGTGLSALAGFSRRRRNS